MFPSIMDSIEILKRPEGKTLEFKRDLSSRDGVLKAIVAFANTAGGTLLIGVEDRTRHVRGVSDPLDLEERVANLVSDRIAPRLVPEIEILPWRRTQVVALRVHPSPSRPHSLTRQGRAGGVYVRVGSTNRRADAELIEGLRRFARGEEFDEQPMPGLDAEALDFLAASDRFRVTIATTRVGPALVDETDEAILESLGRAQGLATSEVAAVIGLSPRATRTRLARLVGRGLVREIGTGPQDPKRRYFLAERGPA